MHGPAGPTLAPIVIGVLVSGPLSIVLFYGRPASGTPRPNPLPPAPDTAKGGPAHDPAAAAPPADRAAHHHPAHDAAAPHHHDHDGGRAAAVADRWHRAVVVALAPALTARQAPSEW